MKQKASERKAMNLQARIKSALDRSTSVSEACRMIGITRPTLVKYCEITGIDPVPSARKGSLTESEKKLFVELFNKGVTMVEIASRVGMKSHSAYREAKRMGLSRPNPSLSRLRSQFSPRNQHIFSLRLKGHTLQEIGNKYEMTRERVRQILDEYSPAMSLGRPFVDQMIRFIERSSIDEFIKHAELGCSKEELHKAIAEWITPEETNKYFNGIQQNETNEQGI